MRVEKSIFRSYDVRGAVPEELNTDTAYAIAKAFAAFNPAKLVVVGYDHRQSTPGLREALMDGLMDAGVDVFDIGQVTTDMTYFASWFYAATGPHPCGVDGAVMITASHMPAQFNGFKFITKALQPIGQGSGMEELYELASRVAGRETVARRGVRIPHDATNDYLAFVRSFIDAKVLRPLKLVMDCGNGVAGPIVRQVFDDLPFAITELCFELDSTFPNHEANPIIPENRKHVEEAVLASGADLGIAWDADADRAYFIDERGQFVHGDFLTALLAVQFLGKHPGASIVYDVRASQVVPDTVARLGGQAFMERVGHAHIKRRMRAQQAVFGGEVSGHYYFADNQYMDNGMIPVLMVLELLGRSGQTMSQLIAELGSYIVSGEINTSVKDQQAAMEAVKNRYADAKQSFLDGVSVDYPDWRCNVRSSNTDPVLRLNLEAKSLELMQSKRDEILSLIKTF
ncbi:MAG: phosphomannomutase/phosphoglucomutase [Parcubacteria group bacterium]|nr:phosphomannomutase/phosphoglucomutase [Parcubacteria group bacterium]